MYRLLKLLHTIRQFFETPATLLAGVIYRLEHACGGAIQRLFDLEEKLDVDRVWWWIGWLSQPVWRPAAAISGFAYAWWVTRKRRRLLWGVPALLLLAPVVGGAAWNWSWGRGDVARKYRQAMQDAREADDDATYRLWERKLAALGVETDRTAYHSAKALADEGDWEGAYQRMSRLAPLEEPGFWAAHDWVAWYLVRGRGALSPEERQRRLGRHLDHLESLNPTGDRTRLARAEWLMRERRYEEASEKLAPLASRSLAAAMLRMKSNQARGALDEARQDARLVNRQMQDRERHDQDLASEDYRLWMGALVLLDDPPAMRGVAEKWHARYPEDTEAAIALAPHYRYDFDQAIRSGFSPPKVLAERLRRLAELPDQEHEVLTRVQVLRRLRGSRAPAREALEQLATAQGEPACLLLALGTAAAEGGEWNEARELLERAVRRDPTHAIAWNNYAYVLTRGSTPDLAGALGAADRALALEPSNHRFRETRGQIHIALGQWKNAVEDLEVALNGMPNARQVRLALATAYEALGETELALVHRRQAQL